MEIELWPSPSREDSVDHMDEEDIENATPAEREKYRRFRKRGSSLVSKDIQLVTPIKENRRRDSLEEASIRSVEAVTHLRDRRGTPVAKSIKFVKEEPEELSDSGELSFEKFASALDSYLQGFSSLPQLIQQYENICRELAEAVKDEASDRHRVIEDRLMRQKASMLHSEASSWALLWHLFRQDDTEIDIDTGRPCPSTSVEAVWDFVRTDETAQTCLRLVQWLEGLASKELDLEKKRKGWYAGSYMQRLGLWDQTQRAIKKNVGNRFVRHLDPDAPTRERARIHPEDQKLEEGLLEDVWKLIRAGRVEEAQNLCRSAGQAWRAASIGGCLLGYTPSVDAWEDAAGDRVLEAIELDGGLGHQRRLWKWACFCASEKIASTDGGRYEAAVFAAQSGNVKHMLPVCSDWESACWALVRSWLDVQIEMELVNQQQIHNEDMVNKSETWPQPVLDQQPRDLISLFQKLYSSNSIHDNVRRSCKEQHRLIQVDLVLKNIPDLLELLKTWISPAREDRESSRPHGHPQVIRFAAHLVLVLRSILPEQMKERYKEKLLILGDLMLNIYAVFLFTQGKEELVGSYASHLAPHLCVELYVNMMELRENDSEHVKRRIFCSAMEYLPLYSTEGGDAERGSIAEICDRFLERSRELKPGLSHVKVEMPGEYQRLVSLRKGKSVQWMCFTPPAGLDNSEQLKMELLARALSHSNVLFREISLVSLWRSTNVPPGAHLLLGHLAEPLKECSDELASLQHHRVAENYREFLDWQEYFVCDALYRNWLLVQSFITPEEREKTLDAAKQALAASTNLLRREVEDPWMGLCDDVVEEDVSIKWLQVFVTATLSKAAEPCFVPDATLCTALHSALYLCMGETASSQRQLTVNVTINPKNENFVNVEIGCLAVEGEGDADARHVEEDGGFLSQILAKAVKGELPQFQAGIMLEVLRMDSWGIDSEGLKHDASFIVKGLCRRCCLPEVVLRCIQIRISLLNAEEDDDDDDDDVDVDDDDDELVAMVADANYGLHALFSSNQLKELLHLEREIVLRRMEIAEENHAKSYVSETGL